MSTTFKLGMRKAERGLTCPLCQALHHDESPSKSFEFVYGEPVRLVLDGVHGFQDFQGRKFPGMSIKIVDVENQQVVMQNPDLYAASATGFTHPQLKLNAHFMAAEPMRSGGKYRVDLRIWDKNSPANAILQMDFKVQRDPHIQVSPEGLKFSEVYLLSKERKGPIFDGRVKRYEHIYMLVEKPEGWNRDFTGRVAPGISTRLVDAEGKLVLESADLIGNQSFFLKDLGENLAPSIFLEDSRIVSPLTWTVEIWDKLGKGRIRLRSILQID